VSSADNIGSALERERKHRGLTLRDLAAKAGVSASLLCSIEKGRVNPSVSTLFELATALEVPPQTFFGPPGAEPRTIADPDEGDEEVTLSVADAVQTIAPPVAVPQVTRPLHRATRPTLNLTDGVTWQLLTPGPETAIEFIEVTYPAGASSGTEMFTHAGREYALIQEGEATFEIGFERFVLTAGDSIAFDSTTPHRITNDGTVPMRAIWVNHKK
jgi:transcriptional regulator with XRE-family HTH domain